MVENLLSFPIRLVSEIRQISNNPAPSQRASGTKSQLAPIVVINSSKRVALFSFLVATRSSLRSNMQMGTRG